VQSIGTAAQDDPSFCVQNSQTVLVAGEKETVMLWRDPALEAADQSEDRSPASVLQRALQHKERRMQQRATAANEAGESTTALLEPGASSLTGSEDAQQLLRDANSLLMTMPAMPSDELRRRLAELGPIPQVLQALGPVPEVLQAFQDLLRAEITAGPDLPQYSRQAQPST
jgi:hypothetical protein